MCRKHGAKYISTAPPALPEPRVRDAAVFEMMGIDMAGLLFLKDGCEVWLCLYTCAVYRAAHLELTSSMSTESFLQIRYYASTLWNVIPCSMVQRKQML